MADDETSAGFSDPKVAINRVYTRTGDAGETGLVGGDRVAKDAPRIEAYGTVDELNAFVGAAVVTTRELLATGADAALDGLQSSLVRVQHELFNLGAILATAPARVHASQPRVTDVEVERLEAEMDEANATLPPLRSFILPGGSRLSVELHQCRTICRRAERLVVRLGRDDDVEPASVMYLNRLSDALFVWSRWSDELQGASAQLWDPNRAASAAAKAKDDR